MAGGAKPNVSRIRVIRANKSVTQGEQLHASGNARVIEVPADKLLAGDESVNVIIRPGDTILAVPSDPSAANPVDSDRGETSLEAMGPGVVREDQPNKMTVLEGKSIIAPVFLIDQSAGPVVLPQAGRREISVAGAVGKPGKYSLPQRPVRLLDALVLAGRAKSDATQIIVLRADQVSRQGKEVHLSGNAHIFAVHVDPLLAGDASLNIEMRAGDTIVAVAGDANELKVPRLRL